MAVLCRCSTRFPVIAGNNGNSGIFVSQGGALVTSRGGTQSQLAWVTPDGTVKPITREARNFSSPSLSPDGHRIAVVVRDQDKSDIWTYDLVTGTLSRLTSVPAASSPSWSPDGSKIYFLGMGDAERFAIWSQQADGGAPAEKVAGTKGLVIEATIAPDGRSLIYTTYNDGTWDFFRIQLDSPSVSIPYIVGRSDDTRPEASRQMATGSLLYPTSRAQRKFISARIRTPRPACRYQMVVAASPSGPPMAPASSTDGDDWDGGEARDVAECSRDCPGHGDKDNFSASRRDIRCELRRCEGRTSTRSRLEQGRLSARRRSQLARGAGAEVRRSREALIVAQTRTAISS